MQVGNTYDELASRTVVDLGCGTVRPSIRSPAVCAHASLPHATPQQPLCRLHRRLWVCLKPSAQCKPHTRVFSSGST